MYFEQHALVNSLYTIPWYTGYNENVQFLFYLLGFNSDTKCLNVQYFALMLASWVAWNESWGKNCAVLCNIYVRDKEEANGQNMSGKWIYNFKVNVDWCSFAIKVVLHKNTKGLSKHEHTVSNCEFFITAGIGYTFYSPLKLGSPYFSAPKLNLMRCKNVNFFIPFITFSLIIFHYIINQKRCSF